MEYPSGGDVQEDNDKVERHAQEEEGNDDTESVSMFLRCELEYIQEEVEYEDEWERGVQGEVGGIDHHVHPEGDTCSMIYSLNGEDVQCRAEDGVVEAESKRLVACRGNGIAPAGAAQDDCDDES